MDVRFKKLLGDEPVTVGGSSVFIIPQHPKDEVKPQKLSKKITKKGGKIEILTQAAKKSLGGGGIFFVKLKDLESGGEEESNRMKVEIRRKAKMTSSKRLSRRKHSPLNFKSLNSHRIQVNFSGGKVTPALIKQLSGIYPPTPAGIFEGDA